MGDGATVRPLKTLVIRSGTSLRVVQNLDAGCSKPSPTDDHSERPLPCESHEYEAAIPGIWVHQVSRRFGNGLVQQSRRADQGVPPGERDLWDVAQLKINVAWRISTWVLAYLGEATGSGGLDDGKIGTAVGPALVTPHCNPTHKLSGVSFFFPAYNLQVDVTHYPDIAPFESKMCPKPAPLTRYAARN